MENKPRIEAEKIHLLHIDVRKYDINTQKLKNSTEHRLSIGHRLMYNVEDEGLKLDLDFIFTNTSRDELLSLKVDYHFKIDNLQDFYTSDDKEQAQFDENMVATLLGIAVSTSRGILLEKLAAQGVDPVIIPIVSPIKILKGK